MTIGDILKEKQPKTYEKLQRKKKERKPKKENLSFCDFDRLMRERSSVDETKCKGR